MIIEKNICDWKISSNWAYFTNDCIHERRKIKSARIISDLDRLVQRKNGESKKPETIYLSLLECSAFLWDFIKYSILIYLDKGLNRCYVGVSLGFRLVSQFSVHLFMEPLSLSQRVSPLFHLFHTAVAQQMKKIRSLFQFVSLLIQRY